VRPIGADAAEDTVARLAKEQFLRDMTRALGDHFTSLASHQIEELVDQKGGREGDDPSAGHCYRLATDGTPKATNLVAKTGGHSDALKTYAAYGVRTGKQFRSVLSAVISVQTGATRQEAFGEVLVVDGHRLDQR